MKLGILFLVQADDHLYDKQGLLLVEQKGFVMTTYTSIQAVYYDGISEEKQEGTICNEKNFDLTPIRNKFYQLAVSELNKNGFEYKVDKEEFAKYRNDTNELGQANLLSHTKTSPEYNLINSVRGDQAEDTNSLESFPTVKCKCIVTKCECIDVPPQTQLNITLPFKISGDIYIRLDFGQVFPDSTSSEVKQFTDLAIGIVKTAKGQFDSFVKSSESFKLIDLVIDEKFIHTILEVKDMKSLTYAYALDDHFCQRSKCDNNTKLDVEITWGLKTARKRKRRAFFGLETNSETNEKIRNAMKVTSGMYDKNYNSIVNLDRMIKQTDKTVEEQTETLTDLYQQICQLGTQSRIQTQMFKIERSIISNVKLLIEILQDCSIGLVPKTFSYATIQHLCEINMNKDICYELKHKARNIMKCKIKSIHLLSTKYLLKLEIKIPNSFKAEYKLYKPLTIPVFDGQYNHELNGFKENIVLQYDNKPEIVLLTQCETKYGILVCNAVQSSDQKTHACLTDIINKKQPKCWTESYKTDDTCFVEKFENGLLISTKFPLQIHQHSLGRTFYSKSKVINGTTIVKNDEDSSYSVACNGILVSTDITDPETLQIHSNHNFEWDDTVQPISNKKLTNDIVETKRLTQINLADLKEKVETAHGDIDFKEILNPRGAHAPTWIIIGTIALIILAIFIFTSIIVCLIKCYRRCRQPIVELAGFVGPTKHQTFNYSRGQSIPMSQNTRII